MLCLPDHLQAAIDAAYENTELRMEDIVSIMQLAREEFHIDQIIVYSNRVYKYQLAHVLTCSAEGVEVHKPITYALTKDEYDTWLQQYRAHPVLDTPVQPLGQTGVGHFLNTGILREGEYFGTITFWSKEKSDRSEEEAHVLLKLRHLCLLFFGMNTLVHGGNSFTRASAEFQKDSVRSGFFVNMQTQEIRTMKLPEGMQSVFPEWGLYDTLLNIYAQNYVEGFYRKQLLDGYRFAEIKRKLTKSNPILRTEFPRIYNGTQDWIRFQIRGEDFRPDGTPAIAMVSFIAITEDVKDNAFLFYANNTSLRTYTTVVALNLNTEQYAVCVNEQRKESVAVSFDFFGHYSQVADAVLPKTSKEEREGALSRFFDVNYLMRHFDASDTPLQCDFSYTENGTLYWLRFDIIKAAPYSPETREVMLCFSDITDTKRTQLLLEEENRQKKYQLEHDPLTGAYNRRGYDMILQQHEADRRRRPAAYIQLDIDYFKVLNDTYGHTFGDEVLKQVAIQLTEAFRADDYVFRFGGDEFAVLLTNYDIDGWSSLGDTQRMIHIRLNQILKQDIYVTLSMGVSYSASGFTGELIALADAALYQAKSSGRAGCCVFDANHNAIFQWRDDIGTAAEENALDQSDTGAYRLELPGGSPEQGRLVCNETSRALMGLDTSMTPEECFQTWRRRVDVYSREHVAKTYNVMLEKGQAESTYLYHHPIQGEIMVRSGGRCLRNENGVVLYGYHQSLQNTRIVLQEDDTQKIIDAMLRLYFSSYYLDLQQDAFFSLKSTEESRHLEKQTVSATAAIREYIQTLVKPAHREGMTQFLDLNTLPERLKDLASVEAEYQSAVADKGWCRARILAVKRNEAGTVTHVQLLVASIDREKKNQLELEKAKRDALELQLRVGELAAKTTIRQVGLIDRETGDAQIYMNGIVSQDAITVSFEEMKRWGAAYTHPLDAALLDKKFSLPYIEQEIAKKGDCTMAFRQLEENDAVTTLVHHYELYKADPSKILLVVEDVTKSAPKGIGRIEEFSVLEQLSESVAIFDYETYDVIYANKTLRDSLGMRASELQGKKCYALFCGRSEPCEFCDKIILDQGQHGFMYRKVEATGKYTFLHGCSFEAAGRKYRLEQALPLDALNGISSDWNSASQE